MGRKRKRTKSKKSRIQKKSKKTKKIPSEMNGRYYEVDLRHSSTIQVLFFSFFLFVVFLSFFPAGFSFFFFFFFLCDACGYLFLKRSVQVTMRSHGVCFSSIQLIVLRPNEHRPIAGIMPASRQIKDRVIKEKRLQSSRGWILRCCLRCNRLILILVLVLTLTLILWL